MACFDIDNGVKKRFSPSAASTSESDKSTKSGVASSPSSGATSLLRGSDLNDSGTLGSKLPISERTPATHARGIQDITQEPKPPIGPPEFPFKDELKDAFGYDLNPLC